MRKDLDFYLNLHYPVTIHPDPDGGFVAEIEELPGCMTQGETLEEAFQAIEDARHGWIQIAYEDGQDIPLPRDLEEYSGKILIRIPKSLHRDLSHAAKWEGVSLNQYIASLVAAGVRGDVVAEKVDAVLSNIQLLCQPNIALLFAKFAVKEEPRQFSEIRELRGEKLARR
jgi:predicted RNase H-like HicB family nuclease